MSPRQTYTWKSRATHPLTVAAALVAVGLAGAAYAISSLMDDFAACVTLEEASIPSPGGTARIVVFSRDCNATVPLTTQLSVGAVAGRFSPESNPPFLITRAKVTASWQSDDVIAVNLSGDGATYRRETRAGKIRIVDAD